MAEKIPLEPSDFEELIAVEMDRLREERDSVLHSPATGNAIELPPSTEEGLRKMAEKEVQLKIQEEQKRQRKEKIKKSIKAEGLTEEELEKIARERLERQ